MLTRWCRRFIPAHLLHGLKCLTFMAVFVLFCCSFLGLMKNLLVIFMNLWHVGNSCLPTLCDVQVHIYRLLEKSSHIYGFTTMALSYHTFIEFMGLVPSLVSFLQISHEDNEDNEGSQT